MSLQTRLADLITALGADDKKRHGVISVGTTATLTPVATAEQFNVTAQAGALAIGLPVIANYVDGQNLLIRIKDNATARAISWNAVYRPVGITLPLTTVISKTLYVGGRYNAADSKFDMIAVGQEA